MTKRLIRTTMAPEEYRSRFAAAAENLSLVWPCLSLVGGAKGTARMTFGCRGSNSTAVDRRSSQQESADANASALVRWLESRQRMIAWRIETFTQAFAGSLLRPPPSFWTPPIEPFTENRSIDESIIAFRDAFRTLGIDERGVKVTWDTDGNWTRAKLLLPSGKTAEKRLSSQASARLNFSAMTTWIAERAQGWAEGIEGDDINDAFAGYLRDGQAE